ncbi:MAG: PspC domain-containing protein [Candidatus Buchananbacteria bacterium]|nr:PspC domain-containing protein [Candidatus Buchananbacteria bacterium]
MNGRRFKKVSSDVAIGGVCAGLAYFLGLPTWNIRMIWCILTFIDPTSTAIIVYFLLWIFMPSWDETPKDYYKISG